MSKWWDLWFVYRCVTDGGRDGLRRPALSGQGSSCTRSWLYLLSMKSFMCGPLVLYIFTSLGCSVHGLFFRKTDRKVTSDLLYVRYTSSTKDNEPGFPALASDPHCGVWGLGWTNCLLYDGPLLGLIFNCQIVSKFDIGKCIYAQTWWMSCKVNNRLHSSNGNKMISFLRVYLK